MPPWIGLKYMKRAGRISLLFLALCGLSAIAAFVTAIGREAGGLPPASMLLCLSAGSCLILAFVHTWRRAWKFLVLLAVSAAAFGGFVILHNVFYALWRMSEQIAVLHQVLEVLHVGCFLVAIFVCPPAFLVGAGGGAIACFGSAFSQVGTGRKAAFIMAAICCIALIVGFFAFMAARVIN
ncbi:MAG TPA: hypothetical protein VMX13_16465 [Sedimentisphaerales bacterium]|nr:hypothetical protein [Sedimentisphaerales bacterium]